MCSRYVPIKVAAPSNEDEATGNAESSYSLFVSWISRKGSIMLRPAAEFELHAAPFVRLLEAEHVPQVRPKRVDMRTTCSYA